LPSDPFQNLFTLGRRHRYHAALPSKPATEPLFRGDGQGDPDWAAAEDMACQMIAAHNRMKGTPDHAELVSMRYLDWDLCPGVECLAFTATAGAVRGVLTCLIWNGDLELHEIGLDEGESERRLAVYLELVFRLPLQHAQAHGLRTIRLGLEDEKPKASRGADFRELFGGLLLHADVMRFGAVGRER
jgi:hypothetical protein